VTDCFLTGSLFEQSRIIAGNRGFFHIVPSLIRVTGSSIRRFSTGSGGVWWSYTVGVSSRYNGREENVFLDVSHISHLPAVSDMATPNNTLQAAYTEQVLAL
jgi:hypothetical protein